MYEAEEARRSMALSQSTFIENLPSGAPKRSGDGRDSRRYRQGLLVPGLPADEAAIGVEVEVAVPSKPTVFAMGQTSSRQSISHRSRPACIRSSAGSPFDPEGVAVQHEERVRSEQRQRLGDAAAGIEHDARSSENATPVRFCRAAQASICSGR